jgi:protein-S-isoprenylcysteine O-methyltransferase Ste14
MKNPKFWIKYILIVVFIVLAAALFISGYFRKRARDEGGVIKRQEEGWFVLFLRMIFAIPLLVVILLNIFYPRAVLWAHFSTPLYLQIIALVAMLCCVPLLWWVFRSIGKNISETILTKESQEFVTSGPYNWVRHPLYGSALVLLLSISLVFGDWIILGYGILGLLAFRLLVIPAEEKQLLDAFGDEYACYQARTGALLPWIK